MIEEYYSLMKNPPWDVVSPPMQCKFVRFQWVYITIYVVNGSIDKHKKHPRSKAIS